MQKVNIKRKKWEKIAFFIVQKIIHFIHFIQMIATFPFNGSLSDRVGQLRTPLIFKADRAAAARTVSTRFMAMNSRYLMLHAGTAGVGGGITMLVYDLEGGGGGRRIGRPEVVRVPAVDGRHAATASVDASAPDPFVHFDGVDADHFVTWRGGGGVTDADVRSFKKCPEFRDHSFFLHGRRCFRLASRPGSASSSLRWAFQR